MKHHFVLEGEEIFLWENQSRSFYYINKYIDMLYSVGVGMFQDTETCQEA